MLGAVASVYGFVGTAAANTNVNTELSLDAQTTWVRLGSGFDLNLSVNSSLPISNYFLRVQVYSRLLTRYALNHPLRAALPTMTIAKVPIASITSHKSSHYTLAPVDFRVAPGLGPAVGPHSGPVIRIDCADNTCDGVYPVDVELVNSFEDKVAATLTTDLIYVGSASSPTKLLVGLALPLGAGELINSSGAPQLSTSELTAIGAFAKYLSSHPGDPLSLIIYPQLLQALQLDIAGPNATTARLATTTYRVLVRMTKNATRSHQIDLLPATTVPIDLASLTAGLGTASATSEFGKQRTSADRVFETVFNRLPGPKIYLSGTSLNSGALKIVTATGLCHMVLPSANLTITGQSETTDTPLVLPNETSPCQDHGDHGPTVFVADSTLAQHVAQSGSAPVLAAHLLLADLAQTYFENPNSIGPRGVVVAPTTWSANHVFTATLFSGLAASPILAPVKLSSLFGAVPVGADNQPALAGLNTPTVSASVSAKALATSHHDLAVLRSVMPTETAILDALSQRILASEAVGLSDRTRAATLAAPRTELSQVANSIQIIGSSRATLTSASGKIPVTFRLTGNLRPLHVELRVKSSELDIPKSESRQQLTLVLHDTEEFLRVSARTSGRFTFTVQLFAPDGSTPILPATTYVVTSTAASGVAIALSLLALAVLGVWWTRSVVRHRQRTKRGAAKPLAEPERA